MNIDICVCTYRRAHLAETLRSLSRLVLKPDWKIRIIIADNDDTPAAQPLIEKMLQELALDFLYVHAPARNISIARNACLDAAAAPLLAFIDDDELANPMWLEALVSEIEHARADAVLGPVQAVYGSGCPGWIHRGDFHSIKPVWVNDRIVTGYTCNVLLRRTAPAFKSLRFRKEFGQSGGEDTVFFAEAWQAGAKIAYTPDAIVTEAVPAERACLSWLVRRRFRAGQTHGWLLLQKNGNGLFAHVKNIAVAAAKILFCLMMALLNFPITERRYFWHLRGAMHAGVIARLLGIEETIHYGQRS